MNLGNRKIELQITRFITGDCPADELLVISGLIESDPRYKKAYTELSKAWELTSLKKEADTFNIDLAWEKVEKQIERQPLKIIHKSRPSIRTALPKAVSYAIRVAAVLLIGFAIFQLFVDRSPQKTFASGNSVSVPVNLADGSVIYLNSASTLKFPEKFGDTDREVYFWGEAFFEIAHDVTRPFIVETGETRVKVLGTSFNIKAYPNTERIEVVVSSGKVLFYHVDSEDKILGEVTLVKGEKGVFNRKTGQIARLINDEPNFLSWKTGILTFSETSLDKVLSAIGQKYGVSFDLASQDLAELKLTATFDNESLDSVLQVLELVHNLHFVNNGNDYLVSKKAG